MYKKQKSVLNGTKKQEKLLHYTMSFVGGIFAIYALLEHSNVFGSAETSNMILLVEDLINCSGLQTGIRIVSLLVYAAGIIFSLWMSKYHSSAQKAVCIVIDFFATAALAFIPKETEPVIALYPVAFAMSIQWCTFKGVGSNSSATTFSTGNFRQFVTNVFNYVTEHDRSCLNKAEFYALTIFSFHAGVAFAYILWQKIHHNSIWIVYLPLAAAALQELFVILQKNSQVELLAQNSGCEEV